MDEKDASEVIRSATRLWEEISKSAKFGDVVDKKIEQAGIDKSRFALFGVVRPQTTEDFVKALKSYLFEPLAFNLKWGKSPRDLDLILEVSGEAFNRHTISYNNMGNRFSEPYAFLDTDCMQGYGPEVITVLQVDGNKKYTVKVNKYSPENEVDGEISLIVECAAFKKEYKCDKVFKTWQVCAVHGGKIETMDIINIME